MKFLSLCTGCGGFDLGLEKAGMQCVGQVEIMTFALKVLKRHWPNIPKHTDILTLLRSDSIVRTYQTETQMDRALRAKEAVSSLNVCELSGYLHQHGYSLKMFPDYFPSMEEEICGPCCGSWPKAATGGPTEFWTVDTSAYPSDAKESSLSDVLEASPHPKYYMSQKGIDGMYRRTMKHHPTATVLMHEPDSDKTPALKPILLKHLIPDSEEITTHGGKTTLPGVLIQDSEPDRSPHRKLTLRNLTAEEKEQLQGFPTGWSLPEGVSLAMPLPSMSPNGSEGE